MTVYIDSLFIINFFMDSVLLFFVQLFAAQKAGLLKVMFGSALLAFYSLGSVFEKAAFLYGILPKSVVCSLVLLLVFGKAGYWKTFTVFWASALLLGGAIYAVSVATPYAYIASDNTQPENVTPVISAVGCAVLYIMLYFMKKITVRSFSRERMFINIDVTYLSRHYHLRALVDTGCYLCEPLSGDAVMLADKRVFSDTPDSNYEIAVSTAAGDEMLPLIFPEKTAGENNKYRVKKSVPIALTPNRLCNDGLYNAIINPEATEDIIAEQVGFGSSSLINILKIKKQTSERKINNDTYTKT